MILDFNLFVWYLNETVIVMLWLYVSIMVLFSII